MKKSSDIDREVLLRKLIGLGTRSVRKTYYPELQRRMAALERFKARAKAAGLEVKVHENR